MWFSVCMLFQWCSDLEIYAMSKIFPKKCLIYSQFPVISVNCQVTPVLTIEVIYPPRNRIFGKTILAEANDIVELDCKVNNKPPDAKVSLFIPNSMNIFRFFSPKQKLLVRWEHYYWFENFLRFWFPTWEPFDTLKALDVETRNFSVLISITKGSALTRTLKGSQAEWEP